MERLSQRKSLFFFPEEKVKRKIDYDLDNTFPPMSSEEHCKVTVHFQGFDTTSLNLDLYVWGNDYNKMVTIK